MELKDDLRVVRVRLRLLGAVADPLLVDQVIAAADYDKLSVPIHGRIGLLIGCETTVPARLIFRG